MENLHCYAVVLMGRAFVICSGDLLVFGIFLKILFSHATVGAGKIVGQIFKERTGINPIVGITVFFIVNPSADHANILHNNIILSVLFYCRHAVVYCVFNSISNAAQKCKKNITEFFMARLYVLHNMDKFIAVKQK